MPILQIIENPDKNEWSTLLTRSIINSENLETAVRKILEDIKRTGDKAVREYADLFDKTNAIDLKVREKEFDEAEKKLGEELKVAIRQAERNISTFHSNQRMLEPEVETLPGIRCWRKSLAIEKIGLYVPGGTAPLFSTLLMLGVPARIAGCKEIIICTPPQKDGTIHPAILYVARLLRITNVFRVGGVQAIAAMAYGTETIPQVYKIFGPGNQWVTQAKKLIQQEGIAIDIPAGPSELAIYADDTAVPAFVAADLLSQCEHGEDSQVILVTESRSFAEKVNLELEEQIEKLPRKTIAEKSLNNSKMFLISDRTMSMDFLNTYAPEHLILACHDAETLAEKVHNAGSVFLGNYAPESAGDYATGTNHTLPTNGLARAYSGVSIDSFVKKISFQKLSKEGLQSIGNTVIEMARAEGLQAHAEAIAVRLKN
ncbi:MAG TPA: histidinol dehydrogenase [Puia sp.]|nr:histidinol dehydrogenase [Puia sp.]